MGGEANNFGKEKLFRLDVIKQVRGNYALVPLVLTIGFGSLICGWHCLRQITRNPDIIINRKGNPKPYESLENEGKYKQFKYFTTVDYKTLSPDPERPSLD